MRDAQPVNPARIGAGTSIRPGRRGSRGPANAKIRNACVISDGDLEAIRQRHRPAGGVRVLLLGESPPPGRGFFYTANSSLYRFTVPVLVEACGWPSASELFLDRFAKAGFYLDDFSLIRGDKPAARSNDRDVMDSVDRIAAIITEDGPHIVVGVLESLRELVARAVALSARPESPWECLPFPHPKNEVGQRRFQEGLLRIVQKVGCGP